MLIHKQQEGQEVLPFYFPPMSVALILLGIPSYKICGCEEQMHASPIAEQVCPQRHEVLIKHPVLWQVLLDFGLSEQIFAKATVKDVSSVGLWLGADVMLEYPLEEAKQLLVRALQRSIPIVSAHKHPVN